MRKRPEDMRRWVEGGDEAARRIEALLAEGKGLIVLTLHLGTWEMGLAHLAGMGYRVNVVLRPEDSEGAVYEQEARRRAGVRVVPAGGSAWNGLDLLLCLRRGEIVAIQGDRPFGPARERVPVESEGKAARRASPAVESKRRDGRSSMRSSPAGSSPALGGSEGPESGTVRALLVALARGAISASRTSARLERRSRASSAALA